MSMSRVTKVRLELKAARQELEAARVSLLEALARRRRFSE